MIQGNPARNVRPGIVAHHVTVTGNGAANVTVAPSTAGLTIVRQGVGVHRVTWSERLGRFDGWGYAFGATTMTALAGYTIVRGDYNVANRTLDFTILNGSNAAADLAAAQYADLEFRFQVEGP